jgi:hypothetical protein
MNKSSLGEWKVLALAPPFTDSVVPLCEKGGGGEASRLPRPQLTEAIRRKHRRIDLGDAWMQRFAEEQG